MVKNNNMDISSPKPVHPSKPCHVGIDWIAFTEYSHVPWFLSFSAFLQDSYWPN